MIWVDVQQTPLFPGWPLNPIQSTKVPPLRYRFGRDDGVLDCLVFGCEYVLAHVPRSLSRRRSALRSG
jgi:hypothetical protein